MGESGSVREEEGRRPRRQIQTAHISSILYLSSITSLGSAGLLGFSSAVWWIPSFPWLAASAVFLVLDGWCASCGVFHPSRVGQGATAPDKFWMLGPIPTERFTTIKLSWIWKWGAYIRLIRERPTAAGHIIPSHTVHDGICWYNSGIW